MTYLRKFCFLEKGVLVMLSLLLFPDSRLRHQAVKVGPFDPENTVIVEQLFLKLQDYQAYGLNAPMFGVSKSIVVMNPQSFSSKDSLSLHEDSSNSQKHSSIPKVLLNPQIVASSVDMAKIEEGSPCFEGISAEVARPLHVTVCYQDLQGQTHETHFDGLGSAVIQHQMDHLMGKSFLDHLSPLKKSLLLKRMAGMRKHADKHHVHGPHCRHG